MKVTVTRSSVMRPLGWVFALLAGPVGPLTLVGVLFGGAAVLNVAAMLCVLSLLILAFSAV